MTHVRPTFKTEAELNEENKDKEIGFKGGEAVMKLNLEPLKICDKFENPMSGEYNKVTFLMNTGYLPVEYHDQFTEIIQNIQWGDRKVVEEVEPVEPEEDKE